MALPAGGGDEYPPFRPSAGPFYPAKRRTVDTLDDDQYLYSRPKRPRHSHSYAQFVEPVAFRAAADPPPLTLTSTTPSAPPLPSPVPRLPSPAPAMERTASNHSITSDPTERCGSTELLEDLEAAQRVRDHLATFRRRNPDSKHERILRSIINPRRRHHHHHHDRSHPKPSSHQHDDNEEEQYPLDNAALESIFSAANEIFFNGRLSRRVAWDWSHSSSLHYDSRVIGTTALRRAAATTRGFETLIVLSSTIGIRGELSRYYGSRPASPINTNIAWRRQRRPARPLYVYSGDEPAPSYVYADPTWQRP
ncbi:hypothetical protein N0V88_003869 [Collariella sp. IMI 366227]|nr:hypothetical protein N0V88_003869 [Collariella sp. IMI 366227]